MPVASPSGRYRLAWVVSRDIPGSAGFIRLQFVEEAQIEVIGAEVTIVGQAPLPRQRGTWNPSTFELRTSGSGPVAGREQVLVQFEGTLRPEGVLNAVVTVGGDGSLGPPVPHTLYQASGTRVGPVVAGGPSTTP
jgi:hypothetical protein